MNEPLEIVRLLAWQTKYLSRVFKNYAKEGKLVEMTVLLIVAKDRFMPRTTLQSNNGSVVNGNTRIHEFILKEMKSLSDAQRKLSIVYGLRSELIQKCEAKRAALMSALILLDLFAKAGDAIGLYFRSQPINVPKGKVAKDIAAILEKAGCGFKDIDLRNIECKYSEIKEAARSCEKIIADAPQQYLGLPLNPPSASFCNAKGWYYKDDDDDEDKNIVKPCLGDAFNQDDPQELISVLKLNKESAGSSFNANSPHLREGKLTQSDVLTGVIATGALGCATAFLEGKTCISVDINATLDNGAHPLNDAAYALNYDLVNLFLCHGADPDFKSGRYKVSLPVEAALDSFVGDLVYIDPASTESINNLFTAICLTQMNKPMETVRLLAWRTKNYGNVFNNYAKEGKLVQMTILLIVAKDRIMPRSTSQSVNGSIVNGSTHTHEIIIEEMKSLSAAQRKLTFVYGVRSELVQKCEAKRAALMSALILLDLFEKAGDVIGLYFLSPPINVPKEKVAKDIASILEKAGCALKDIDLRNIDCKNFDLKEAARSFEKITADRPQQHIGLLLNPPSVHFCNAKRKSWSKPPGIQVEQVKRSYHNWSLALRSVLQSSHCLRHHSGFNKLIKVQSKGESIAAQRPMCLPSKSSSPLVSLALAFKRVMRHK